jgi:colanic acid/amylovoran biosynthesis glycosyltransferase
MAFNKAMASIDSMRKIAHYPETYLTLTQTWLYGQMALLTKFQPLVLCRNIENRNQFPLENIYSYRESLPLPARCYYGMRYQRHCYLKFYEDIIHSQAPVLLHAHFGNCGYEILPLSQKFSLPQITSFYGYDATRLVKTDPKWNERYKKLFSLGTAFIAEGNHMAETLHQLGCPRQKLKVLRLGVDLLKLPFRERSPEKGVRILAAGRFREKKGHTHAIEAFAAASRDMRNITLTLVGGAAPLSMKEMREKREILATIRRLGVADRVALPGFLSYGDFIRELYNHHIFISPSILAADGDSEGGAPVSIIEASASGMPILSTRHCDIPEVVLDGKTGYLAPEGDIDALTERLIFLLKSPEIWKNMGLLGHEHIAEHYDLRKQVPKLEQLYQEVLDEKPAGIRVA